MAPRSEIYKKQQDEITDKIINILELDANNSIVLYYLDDDIDKQNKILELIPDIKKYFSWSRCVGIREPENTKRVYVSIIRQFTKFKYKMFSSDYAFKLPDGQLVRSKKYIFMKK